MIEHWESMGFCALTFIRYNPDSMDGIRISTERRRAQLSRILSNSLDAAKNPDGGLDVQFIAFSKERQLAILNGILAEFSRCGESLIPCSGLVNAMKTIGKRASEVDSVVIKRKRSSVELC